MMTNRWLNVVLAVIVTVGLAGVAIYERPRAAEERAELLDQDVATIDDADDADAGADDAEAEADPDDGGAASTDTAGAGPEIEPGGDPDAVADADGSYGVTASHPLAVDVGIAVLDAGGNAVDAAVAVSYALSVVEPFGSGLGGGGAMLVHPPGEAPTSYDYREIAPQSGEIPASEIGVPGFAAGLAHVHAEHGTADLASLITPAIELAEDGFEVDAGLAERLEGAAHRLPINQLPRYFPDGQPLQPGDVLVQPEHADALRMVRDEGPAVMHSGELGQAIAEAVGGLDLEDLEAYEVVETPVATGELGDYEVLSGGPPVSGPTLVEHLQIAEAGGIADLEPGSAEHTHLFAQAFRIAYADRTNFITDPVVEDVPLEELLSPDYAADQAGTIPDDGFVPVDDESASTSPETDTTHIVTVDPTGTMVSTTNTLSNFFGSGLPISGFFMNDQLKNFSRDPESVNYPAPGKRPRSFITPTIVASDDQPVLGLGSPGGRRIPTITAQVLLRWGVHGESIEDATTAPRVHLEGRELQFEESPDAAAANDLVSWGYEVVDDIPLTEYYGAIQALLHDPETGELSGIADERRSGDWRVDQP